jgi:hypothetical protein
MDLRKKFGEKKKKKKTKMVYACVHALVSLQSICWMENLGWFSYIEFVE